MSTIKSFKGFRPPVDKIAEVASRPYDVLNRAEAKAESNPHSFLRVIRSEIDLPDAINAYDSQVYKQAKTNFEQFVANGVLVQDQAESLYVYAQTMNGKQQIGLVACTSIDDYINDRIKKHEYTRPKKEKDRITHISTTHLHTGPVLMAYPQVEAIDLLIDAIVRRKATYDFTAADGIQHTLWVVENPKTIEALVLLFDKAVPNIYIADGHHRAASSTKVGLRMREENPNYNGKEGFNYFLSVLFPDNQLQIIDYNRVVKDLNGMNKGDFLLRLTEHFEVIAQTSAYKPKKVGEFSMYLNNKWYRLLAKSHTQTSTDPVESLDISILSRYVLDPILGIKDQRTDERIDFVGGIRGLEELEKRVDSGEMYLAFAIYPVAISQLIDVANSGRVMPPKSTWFEPKLRSGMVVHQF